MMVQPPSPLVYLLPDSFSGGYGDVHRTRNDYSYFVSCLLGSASLATATQCSSVFPPVHAPAAAQ